MTPQSRGNNDRQMAVAIGAEIAYWRRRRGLTRKELGELVDRSDNTIGRYERADTVPDVADTWAIARALKVPLSMLLDRAAQSVEEDTPFTDSGTQDPHGPAHHSDAG